MKKVAGLLIAFLIACLSVSAEKISDYRLRMITMDDGLVSNTVRNIVQDRYGFIWFGTDNGLCRYDGTRIYPYRISENGVDQYISALCSTDDGLIVGTGKGLFLFSFRTETFTRIIPELTTLVTHICLDKDGNVWIAAKEKGPYRYSLRDGSYKCYSVKGVDGYVSQILVTNDNQVWVVTHQARALLARLNKMRDCFETVSVKGTYNYSALAIMQSHDGTIWLGTWENGLMKMSDNGTLHKVAGIGFSQSFSHIHTLFEYASDCILVGCDEGLFSYNPQTGAVKSFLSSDTDIRFVYSICRDKEGGLWVGTFYNGVNYMSSMAQRFDAMPGDVISRFCEDGSGRVWVASDDGGLRCYLPHEHRYTTYPGMEKLHKINAHALCLDGDELWIGTYTSGVFVLNVKTGTLRHYVRTDSERSLDDISSYAIYKDRNQRIWVATMNGLCLYDRKNDDFTRVRDFLCMVIDMDEDDQGNIWFSTQGDGLWRLSAKGDWKQYADTVDGTGLGDTQVNCTYIDAGGQIWVGTQNGLFRYNTGKDRFEQIKLDIPRQSVYSIVEDVGVLWIAGGAGVVKYEPDKGVCRFTRQDGLICDYFQPNSGMKASDGRIYFGTIQGFNVFSPYQIKINHQAPPVLITSFELYNIPVEVGSKALPCAPAFVPEVNLSWRDKMFSISFASLSYCSPEKNSYAYMLEGFDKQWNYVGTQNKATYTNIPAGTYIFRVKATNNDGEWSTSEARLQIVMHPPFWWSFPAKIFYLLLTFALIYYYVHYRLKRAEKCHCRELLKLKNEKEEEVKNARLNFFTMIAHEIRTPVSLIIGPLENLRKDIYPAIEADLDAIDRNAHRLLELVNQLLDFRKVEQKALVMHFAPQNICQLLRSVSERFEPTFTQGGKKFTVDYPDAHFTAIVDSEAIVKIVSNLLTNANKYTKDEVRLFCTEEPDGEYFRIEVSDNGVGIRPEDRERIFAPFFQAQDNKPGTGIGLSIVKDIVSQHRGTISVDSSVGRGSTFTVILPVSQEMEEEEQTDVVPGDEAMINVPNEVAVVKNQVPVSSSAAVVKLTVLIVDDNEEMVRFLARNFEEKYHVLTAHDGIEALECILRLQNLADLPGVETTLVSIVICDWMMPRMDGAELCRRIRKNPATSHIPFVMLTAKTDNTSKTEGMNVGADAYVEKPFSVNYLQACVSSILEMRSRLRERFSSQPLVSLKEIAVNEEDDDFLERASQLIEENLSSEDLSVEFLSEQLEVSRSTLFAKFRSLADMTPGEMIRTVRLKKAAKLLCNGEYQIGEVGYMVGFTNASHFSACFLKQFGVRPAAFVKQVDLMQKKKGTNEKK